MNVKKLPKEFETLPASAFGDNAQLADKLAALIVTGVKTATCGALWQYQAEGTPLPIAGEREIVLDGAGNPVCVIENVEVFTAPFNSVDPQFAYDEGEGDRSHAYWRDVHEKYFRRLGPFAEDMLLVCSRFRLVAKLNEVDQHP